MNITFLNVFIKFVPFMYVLLIAPPSYYTLFNTGIFRLLQMLISQTFCVSNITINNKMSKRNKDSLGTHRRLMIHTININEFNNVDNLSSNNNIHIHKDSDENFPNNITETEALKNIYENINRNERGKLQIKAYDNFFYLYYNILIIRSY